MNVFNEESRSCWMREGPDSYPALETKSKADVVVIGSGIAGLSAAYELARRGASVLVLDRGFIGRGMTARTSAHLTTALDDFYSEMIPKIGEDRARAHFASQDAAIKRIAYVQEDEAIDCDFAWMDAYLFLTSDQKPEILDQERDACKAVGFDGVERVNETPLGEYWRADGYLRFPNQGRFHPLKYIDGLARAVARMNGRLYANSPVIEIDEDAEGVTITLANGAAVRGDYAIVATNAPIGERALTSQLVPYRTYVLGGLIPRGTVPDHLYWDTEEPYHYVRLHPWGKKDLLLVGGEDHKSGEANDAPERFKRLRKWGHERFPQLSRILYRWSGQVIDTPDFAALIGKMPGRQRIFMAGGDSGQGITHGVVAGMELTSMILDRRAEWAAVYDPGRIKPGVAASAISAVADMMSGIVDRLTPGEISSVDELRAGEGGILRVGTTKIAICRDRNGELHRLNASCTHFGCVVRWNSFEQCWDCPCHGSQFAPNGETLNAPAVEPLKPAE